MKSLSKPNGMSTRRPTLKTIAEETGLSLSTVSLSLRGGAKLKEATRKKVLEAADRLGYVPDRAGVRLRTGRTNVLCLVLDGSAKSIEFTRHLIEGIGCGIQGTRYHLNVTPEFESPGSTSTLDHILRNQLADGVILTHTAPRDPRVQALTDSGLPFVTHGRTEFYSPHPYHDFDSQVFVEVAFDRLVEQGCRNIMLASPNEQTMNHHTIVGAFRQCAAARVVATRVLEKLSAESPPDEIRRFGLELSSAPDRPDGIICDGEMLALPLLSGLRDGGVRLGEDILTVVKQTSDVVQTIFPRIDTVTEDVAAAGRELARILLARIEGAPVEELQTLGQPKPRWLK